MRLTGYDHLGTFTIVSGKIRVADPCYRPDTWCLGFLTDVKNGTWNAYVKRRNVSGWGTRNTYLVIVHESAVVGKIKWDCTMSATIGVDSGQAGFFDDKKNTWHDKAYETVCAMTLETELEAGVLDRGVVSSSGIGDGSYSCRYTESEGEVIAAELRFI